MVRCPVQGCGKSFLKDGVERHITVMHPEYRKAHPLHPEEPESRPVIAVRKLSRLDEPTTSRDSWLDDIVEQSKNTEADIAEREKLSKAAKKVLLKRKPVLNGQHATKPLDETPRKSLRERLAGMFLESTVAGANIRTRTLKAKSEPLIESKVEPEPELEVESKPEPEAESRDLEGLLDMLYRIPILLILFGSFMYVWFNWGNIIALGNHPLVEFYGYLLLTISEPISIIILAITGAMMYLVGLLIYKLGWRLIFPDMQLKSYKEIPVYGRSVEGKWVVIETKKIFIPPTRRGRIYLMVGRGRWDRMYRKRTGKPAPDVVTIYYRDFAKSKNPFANPFKVLASCEKGYLTDPAGTRLQKDGLFRRTLIATHMRRDTEDNTTVWWFEDEPYAHKPSDSRPYTSSHTHLIEAGLGKVSQACGMDSSIQKDQMRNSVSYLPKQLILEDKYMTEQIDAIMRK